MDWTGEGILLSARPHGESAAIIEVFTEAHGVYRGVVRGGGGRRLAPVLQPGAQLHLAWRARLEDHLGVFTVELLRGRAAPLLGDPLRLAALNSVCALAVFALPDREPQPRIYALSVALLDRLAEGERWFGAYLGWERALLEETGYGLDLSACAVTGAVEGLAYVSPRTGRAVTALGAGDYADRLLVLPDLLLNPGAEDSADAMAQGLRVTGLFLTDVLAPALGTKALPEARARLVQRICG